MSDWIGPNMYHIVSALGDTLFVDLNGGSAKEDAKVEIWYLLPLPRSYTNHKPELTTYVRNFKPNTVVSMGPWEFVYLGIGDNMKEEYHLINREAGTLLTAPCKPRLLPSFASTDTDYQANSQSRGEISRDCEPS